MAKQGSGEELVERGNGAEGLAPPAAKFFFFFSSLPLGFSVGTADRASDSAFGPHAVPRMTEQNEPLQWWGQMEMRLVSFSVSRFIICCRSERNCGKKDIS